MIIEINANIPIEWDRKYYTIEETKKETRYCDCCDNTGKIEFKGATYGCPKCKGDWRFRKVSGSKSVYSVGKWELYNIQYEKLFRAGPNITITFQRSTDKTLYERISFYYNEQDGELTSTTFSNEKKIYADYSVALAEVKRLNAEEKKKQE